MKLFNFGAMSGEEPKDPPLEYSLRRTDRGEWQACLTEASRRESLKALAAEIQAGESYDGPARQGHAGLQELRRAQLAELERPTVWQPLVNEVASSSESQYQRFLRHYKES